MSSQEEISWAFLMVLASNKTIPVANKLSLSLDSYSCDKVVILKYVCLLSIVLSEQWNKVWTPLTSVFVGAFYVDG